MSILIVFYLYYSQEIDFLVALEMRNVDKLRDEFMTVSNPKSSRYGKFYDLHGLHENFSLESSDRAMVVGFFESIPGAVVQGQDSLGDFLYVRAPIQSIEETLSTKIEYFIPKNPKRSVNEGFYRAIQDLMIPSHIEQFISFTSLTSPIHNLTPRMSKAAYQDMSSYASVSVMQGNEEALVQFVAECGDGLTNYRNPPCSNLTAGLRPLYTIRVTEQPANISNPYDLTTEPLTFAVSSDDVYCFDSVSKVPCNGTLGSGTCYCLLKVSLSLVNT